MPNQSDTTQIPNKYASLILVGSLLFLGMVSIYAGTEARDLKKAVLASSMADERQDATIDAILQTQADGKKATEKLTDAVIELTIEIAKIPIPTP